MGVKNAVFMMVGVLMLAFAVVASGCSGLSGAPQTNEQLVKSFLDAKSDEDRDKLLTARYSYEPLLKGTLIAEKITNTDMNIPDKYTDLKVSSIQKYDGMETIDVKFNAGDSKQQTDYKLAVVTKDGKKMLQPDTLVSVESYANTAKITGPRDAGLAIEVLNVGKTADGHTVVAIQFRNNSNMNYSWGWASPTLDVYAVDDQGNKIAAKDINSISPVTRPRPNPAERFNSGTQWLIVIPFADFAGKIKSLSIGPLLPLRMHGLPSPFDSGATVTVDLGGN